MLRTPDFFQGAHPEKIWVEATLKKSQVAPYKNLGRFYKIAFKSLLRVQIKRASIQNKVADLICSQTFFIFSIWKHKIEIGLLCKISFVDRRQSKGSSSSQSLP